jgi:hypothetical protein
MVDDVRPLARQTLRTRAQSIDADTSPKTRDERDRYPEIEE